jgi:hypothetical protein
MNLGNFETREGSGRIGKNYFRHRCQARGRRRDRRSQVAPSEIEQKTPAGGFLFCRKSILPQKAQKTQKYFHKAYYLFVLFVPFVA